MLLYTYGITGEQYDDLLRRQEGNCAICGRHNLEFSRKLAVDHDHHTLEIRGILCQSCNREIIGKLRGREGAEILRKAADYLDKEYTGWIIPKKRKKRRRKK
jgi:DNA-directed RNA polymerase subunit RPC12/RpoP